MQEGCGYKNTLHRYFAPLAKYFTVRITYQPPLVHAIYKYWGIEVLIIGTNTFLRDMQVGHVTQNWSISFYWLT